MGKVLSRRAREVVCGWGVEKRFGRLGKVVHTSIRARDKASHI